jgi:small subunit ribosomal protein S8e
MAITQNKDRKKPTGGLRSLGRKKKKFEIGRPFVQPIIGEKTMKVLRTRGGNKRARVLMASIANVSDGKKVFKAKIKQVMENNANPFFIRRNVLTKGAIIETEKGFVRITSRPGQEGDICGVLLKDYKPALKKQ